MIFLQLDDFTLPGHGLAVSSNMEIRTEELSGETSGTDEADKGVKPKTLTVTLSIRYTEKTDLTKLTRIAEAKGANGEMKVYSITHETANALGIRQVKFTDNYTVKPGGTLKKWDVSFTLKEYKSIPEMAEQREKPKETIAMTSDGLAYNSATDAASLRALEAAMPTATPETSFAKITAAIDEDLA